jgi:TRAP-type C4-dicarboxylate transport system permease large subunit
MDIQDIADEIIGLSVVGAATGCGIYVTYLTGEVPGFLTLMAGAVVAYYFTKEKKAA